MGQNTDDYVSIKMSDSAHFSFYTVAWRIFTVLFYALASSCVIFINKIILTNYGFPSYFLVAVSQMFSTIFVLSISHCIGLAKLPRCNSELIRKIFPLPLFFLINLISGLGGTQKLNLPMFTVMRKFSLLFILAGEYLFLKTRERCLIQFSVFTMIFGAVVAASDDFTFDFVGYLLILINDLATAANGICTKMKLNAREAFLNVCIFQDLGKDGLLFYNALLMLPFLVLFTIFVDDLEKIIIFPYWTDPGFVALFLSTCFGGFVLNYATFLCTQYNTALTTSCIGTIKNIAITYIGMVSSGDYFFSATNFIGINISVVGSIVYSYGAFTKPPLEK